MAEIINRFLQLEFPACRKVLEAIFSIINNRTCEFLVPNSMLIGWILKFFASGARNDEYFDIISLCFNRLTNSECLISKSAGSVITWLLFLLQNTSLINRHNIINKYAKIIQKSNVISLLAEQPFTEFLIHISLWKNSPIPIWDAIYTCTEISKLYGSVKNEENMLPFSNKNIKDIMHANTIYQSIASIYLSFYLDNSENFECLMCPIFLMEILGTNSLFFPSHIAKISILDIYLRHVYSLETKSKSYNWSTESNICIRIVEISAFILMEISSLNLREVSDVEIDQIQECIKFVELNIDKHVPFSTQHSLIPLIIILKFIFSGVSKIINAFCNLLEHALSICHVTLNEICASISTLYIVYQNQQTDSSSKHVICLSISKLLKKYINIFQNCGLGSLQPITNEDKGCDLTKISIKNDTGMIYFDINAWRQIVVWSEEHPLFLNWITKPMHQNEKLRQQVSIKYMDFISFIESTTSDFFIDPNKLNAINQSFHQRMFEKSKDLRSVSYSWNEWAQKFCDSFKLNFLTFKNKHLFVLFPHHPLIVPFSIEIPYDYRTSDNFYKNLLMIENECGVEKSNREDNLVDENVKFKTTNTCTLIYFGVSILGEISCYENRLLFRESLDNIKTYEEMTSYVVVDLKFEDIQYVYENRENDIEQIVEFYMKNGSSYFLKYNDKKFGISLQTHLGKSYSNIRCYNSVNTASSLKRNLDLWQDSLITNFTYFLNINMLCGKSFHLPSKMICLPQNEAINTTITPVFPLIYKQIFTHVLPFSLNDYDECVKSKDPLLSTLDFQKIFQSEMIKENIKKFYNNNFNDSEKVLDPNLMNFDMKMIIVSDVPNKPYENINFTEITLASQFRLQNHEICPFTFFRSKITDSCFKILFFRDRAISTYLVAPASKYPMSTLINYLSGSDSAYSFTFNDSFQMNWTLSEIYVQKNTQWSNVKIVKKIDDSRLIVGGLMDNSLILIDSNQVKAILFYHTDVVTSIECNSDTSLIFSGANDGTLCIWDIKSITSVKSKFPIIIEKPLKIIYGHSHSITSIRYHEQFKCVASLDSNLRLQFHSILSGLSFSNTDFMDLSCKKIIFSACDYIKTGYLVLLISDEVKQSFI
ncbi:hypothetical protein RF11_15420 [Thelohanellus kitauei]|uniref:Beige/BEACH domain containing protein n=1 Tax=Thelohanellus kitauei TaxID=669202 RepID=A0A0C2NKB7_THEKT|nr:hypothetical protein RF11_15420 [Thelohanellus kitauei]